MITVIIPYYQKNPGVLSRALASIAGQLPSKLPLYVIIVDDASPAPAGPEILNAGTLPFQYQIISQSNGGPGAARNTALNNLPHSTRYVAFLDSDDEWSHDHLARAIATLEAGYDFYFADHYQLGQTITAFERAGRIQPDKHPQLAGLPSGLHAYQGDMFDQIMRGNVIGTSTVVYNFERFQDKRFRIEFANAGEDYLFWMELVTSGVKIAFSSQPEARYGKGVNIYSAAGWGSDQHLLRIHNELKYRKTTRRLFKITAIQKNYIDSCVRDLRIAFARDLLHRAAHFKKIPLKLLAAQFRIDPLTYFVLLLTIPRLLLEKRQRYIQ